MLTLKNAMARENGDCVATYVLRHSTPGRNGTTLEAKVVVERRVGGEVGAELKLEAVIAADAETALDALAGQLERAAQALRARGTPRTVLNDYPDSV